MSRRDAYELVGTESSLIEETNSLRRESRSQFRRNVRGEFLSQFAGELGDIDFRAVDDQGNVRMIMSAKNLLDEFGVSANLLARDAYGKPTFWGNADDGSFTTAAGNLISSYKGLVSNNRGVFLENQPAPDQRIFYGGLLKGQQLIYGQHFFELQGSELAPANNSFESGFTGWTTAGTPVQVEDSAGGGKYCAEVTNVNTVAMTFATAAGDYFLLQFMVKENFLPQLGTTGVVAGYQPGSLTNMPSSRWVRCLVLLKASGASITVTFSSLFGTAVRFDEVSCYKVRHGRTGFEPSLTLPFYLYEIYAENGIVIGTGPGSVGVPSGVEYNTFLRVMEDFQLPINIPTPATGYITIFASGGSLWVRDSTGTDTKLGGVVGGGELSINHNAPTSNQSINNGYSVYVAKQYEVVAGVTTEIGATGILEIG